MAHLQAVPATLAEIDADKIPSHHRAQQIDLLPDPDAARDSISNKERSCISAQHARTG
jgi:hypothetical protein